MRFRNIKILVILISLFITSCIERYYLDDSDSIAKKIVIDGVITDGCEPQKIVVSYSSSTDWATFIPLSDCNVDVINGDNVVFSFAEDVTNPGYYYGLIDEMYLQVGSRFKLRVITPDHIKYESTFEEMLPCPEVDSVYYKIERETTDDPNYYIDGLQFYIDFDASDYFGRYYRWVLEETYEYHSFWPITDYISETGRYVEGDIDYSKYVCYKTNKVDDIFTLSTSGLTQNRYAGAELIFVNDHTQRLLYNYRLLVKQLSLSEDAYNYWEKIKLNNKSNAGLFTTQPALIKGNVVNVDDSTESVLGYFSVSSVTTKQLLLKTIAAFSFEEMFVCVPGFFKYTKTPLEPRPLYMFYALDEADGTWSKAWSAPECFDCTLRGGVVEKPVFFE